MPEIRMKLGFLCAKGNATLTTVAITLFGLMTSVVAVDVPLYFNYQNMLQTSVDAAALAGAAALPDGKEYAEEQALAMAQENWVGNQQLTADDLQFHYDEGTQMTMKVGASIAVPTLMSKVICSLNTGEFQHEADAQPESCDVMQVHAYAKGVPAARDTMLVIDNSSSMAFQGTWGGRKHPMYDVQLAAMAYVNYIKDHASESVDRIGVVSFAYDAQLLQGLRSSHDDPHFGQTLSKIDEITVYNAKGWNTNYEAPLKVALNELQAHGRKNAEKVVIFMTDGLPNLPAPTSFYQYSYWQPYSKCTNMVDNSSQVKAMCTTTYKNGKKTTTCPVLPNPKITDSMISASAVSCGVQYTDYLVSSVQAQVQRAKELDVTIHSIIMYDDSQDDNATAVMRRLRKEPAWDPALVDYMANETEGTKYTNTNYNGDDVADIYETIAKDIKIRLAH
ncbi:MAG: vWA domain-containing protein [Candidatus Melainabacteria bacterium]|nr:vWA domain-containing protein [Candidatus Melainabacteria bacterium]